jgi:hypothetical protein
MPANKRVLRFVRALVTEGSARRDGGDYVVEHAGDALRLGGDDVRRLLSAGVLLGDAESCRAAPEARLWLKRAMLEADAFAAQHRIDAVSPEGARLNLAESPLARLAAASSGEPAFLERHHVEAGERVRKLAERAQLQPRVTMSYSAAHTAGGKNGGRAAEISDMAAEARRALAEIHGVLPRDCAGVVLDVCGLLKGLQVIESERGWPRRSAKLVLRIGLDQLARHYGFAPMAVGVETRRRHAWVGENARPTVVG